MSSQASILLFGHDSQLLETRRLVLERSGHRVCLAADLTTLARLASDAQFDLLIFCHTISMEECGRAIALIHTYCRHVQSILLAAGQSACSQQPLSYVVETVKGPENLLNAIAQIVHSKARTHPHLA